MGVTSQSSVSATRQQGASEVTGLAVNLLSLAVKDLDTAILYCIHF